MRRFEGRHVAITGAGTGIGRAVALRVAAEGGSVSLFGRREAPLQEVAAEVEAQGGGVFWRSADVRDAAALGAGLDAGVAALGPLHAFVANAGVGGPNRPGPADRFDEIIGINLAGTYHSLRAAQARLAVGRTTHLLSVASVLGRIGVPGYTAYCAAKAGILGLTRALAAELAGRDVQVNAICPGWVDTEMAQEGLTLMARARKTSFEALREEELARVPLRRMNTPEEIAGVVAWLISDDGRGVTGQGIDVNGGAWMG
jgi:NAD(P)-dependent dehydrogenase (short-subunit alcohol dehydrogenase family)